MSDETIPLRRGDLVRLPGGDVGIITKTHSLHTMSGPPTVDSADVFLGNGLLASMLPVGSLAPVRLPNSTATASFHELLNERF